MLFRRPLLLLFLLFCCAKGFCATFVVTSNADSGPGTLRDALTQAAANGTTETDYINFNLSGTTEAAITIILQSQLPVITSNIVIDGTTQPTLALGVSNAHVILQPADPSNLFCAFVVINAQNFEIYGMYIRDFNGIPPFEVTSAFYIKSSDNIIIGAPGKGNIISNCGYVISDRAYYTGVVQSSYSANNLTISSNFFGFEPDGKTLRGGAHGYEGGIDFSDCQGNITIGGDNTAQRNIFGNGAQYIEEIGSFMGKSTILIKNNYLNYDVNGNPVRDVNLNASEIYGIFITDPGNTGVTDYPYDVTITNNNIKFPLDIIVDRVTGKIIFQGNNLLNDPTETHGYGPGISFWGDAGVLIGGLQPGEPNVIYGSPIRANSSTSILLHQNSIYCVNVNGTYAGAPPNPIYMTNTYQDPKLPVINIGNVTATSVSGTATPLSQVELFKDDDCVWCEPLTYFATVNADANGNWSYTGPINKGIIASATLNGYTSLFTTSGYLNNFTIVNSACGNTGSITGIDISNSGGYTITDASGKVVSTNESAKNLPPGTYTLTTNNLSCASTFTLTVFDATPAIISSGIQIVEPGCGNKNGSITGLGIGNNNYQVLQNDYGAYSYVWKDAGGNTVGTGFDLTGVGAGTYTFQMTYVRKNGCTATYGPVTLKNATGPNIDQSNASIQSTNCGQSTGSITGLVVTGTGTLKYIWWNSQQQTVGTDKDLTGQPAGTYKLEVTDDSSCGAVYTTDITIPETNGITMDETGAATTPSSCKNNGSVTGIQVTGATQYKWTDASGKTIGTQPDLTNIAPGTYILTASNTSGCSKTSKPYTVMPVAPTVYPTYTVNETNTCAGSPTGSLSITTDDLVASLRWVDSKGNSQSNPTINNLSAGTYSLYLTNKDGCEIFYNNYIVNSIPQLEVNPQNLAQVTDDECNLKAGGVNGIQVTGGVQPYTYAWTDASGNIINTNPVLTGVGAGTYTLTVTDASACGPVTATFTVNDNDSNLPTPSVSNVQVCSSGSLFITVNNAAATNTYNLYGSESSTTPVAQSAGGKFKVDVTSNTTFYISQVNGTCESSRAQVNVTVGLSAMNIPNTFTPNGDGINDYWQINNIENYPQAVVQIFTRDGQKIFESKGYQVPFDGTYKGQKLPSGVYYFIINLNSNCSLLSGSLTILR